MHDEIVREFLIESTEILDRVDRDLVALEQNPADPDLLASVFRGVHTIKGTCSFLGFTHLEATAHSGENLLSALRDGRLHLNVEITSALLTLIDALRSILAHIEADGTEGERDDADLIQTLNALKDGTSPPSTEKTPSEQAPPEQAPVDQVSAGGSPATEQHLSREQETDGQGASAPNAVEEKTAEKKTADKAAVPREAGSVADSTIRVSVSLLDTMMNLVGELVLARNQIVQHAAQTEDASYTTSTQHLGLITSELQRSVMKTRLQPIEVVFDKLPRLVRDAALACGKEVRLDMEGRDTELDRTLIEAIKDPLTHMVRNAVDHGIETPDERAACGKARQGSVALRAYHEGGQVIIELSDDGAGINVEKLKAKALSVEAITPAQAAQMTDQQAQHLIFSAGLSTAQSVSTISGRGVGMDVVRTNIEQIGGQVSVSSTPGAGTSFKVKIPLTLAIVPALIVAGQGHAFAIPQVGLQELVRLEAHKRASIEMVCGTPVYRLRGELLPLVDLNDELRLADYTGVHKSSAHDEGTREGDSAEAAEARALNIIVLRTERCKFGLIVHEICDMEEVVVKPISAHLKELGVYAGATIRGDGTIALILDVDGLARRVQLAAEHMEAAIPNDDAESAVSTEEAQTFMLTSVGDNRRVAVPARVVLRLEECRARDIEWVGDRAVLQYRGGILELAFLRQMLHMPPREAEAPHDTQTVVVCEIEGHSVGLVVERILDVVEAVVDTPPSPSELTHMCIIEDAVAEVFNPACLMPAGHATATTSL